MALNLATVTDFGPRVAYGIASGNAIDGYAIATSTEMVDSIS